MPLSDSHIHLFAAGYPGKYGPLFPKGGEVDTYEAIRAVHQIERALVVGYEGEPWAKGNNQYVARLAQTRSWIAPVAFSLPAQPPSAQQMQKLWSKNFCGLSLYLMQETDVEGVINWPAETFAALNAKRAIVSLNVPMGLIDSLRPFFSRLAQTRILISHLGMPDPIDGKNSAAATRKLFAPLTRQTDLPHLGVKLSGFYACNAYPHPGLKPVLDILLHNFGERRLYWGSDFSPALDDVTFHQTIEAARTYLGDGAAAKAIFHKNLNQAINRVR